MVTACIIAILYTSINKYFMHNEYDTCRKSTQLCLKCLSVSYIMPDKQVSSDVYKTLYNISPMCGMGEGGVIYNVFSFLGSNYN